MIKCVVCQQTLRNDPAPDGTPTWIDSTCGDVCALAGDDIPHTLRYVDNPEWKEGE